MGDKIINFSKVEKKWQDKWEKAKCFRAKEKGKKYYVLEMFPYPSASGLHMGHALNYTIGDIYSRFKRMNGFNVLYPMGFDALGLPAENAAIKAKSHPKPFTERAIQNYIKQMKELGLSYDWTKIVKTCEPEYYQWNQYFFLKFLEKGLVYRKKASVNWCKKCKTVLANEQVHNGKCWRHGDTEVEIKQLEQWFIKTTKYSEELLKTDKLQWPDKIKKLQKNWIGKSFGTEINFEIIKTKGFGDDQKSSISDINNEKWPIFTTRPDTIYGVTFMVVSAQHLRLMELVTEDKKKDVKRFLKKIKSVSEKEMEDLEKEGVFTGSYAVNPVNGNQIPVYAGNFVVADYGSGMVMAVPAHDQRDFEFAKKYKIDIKQVIKGGDIKQRAHTNEGIMINSDKFNGISNEKAKEKIIDFLIKSKLGKRKIQYKFRDWLVSRQRYWGTPIPIIYCDKCGIVPVSEKDLPIKLPERVEFGRGNPLETADKWVNVKCSKCGGKAKRETDTMDTFFDSSWYYLRYCDNKNNNQAFDEKKVNYWMPVDQYIGGAEHACMHLIYARFFTKALRDLGFLKFDEPFTRLFNQGMLHGPDGEKMSKSKGNVILPEAVSEKYGIDTARLFLVSVASPEKDIDWSEKGIKGSLKLIIKIVDYVDKVKVGKSSKVIESKINNAIKQITQDIENLKYNLAVIKFRQLFESFEEEISKKDLESFLKIFSVFCPHIAEELWEKIKGKGFISLAEWPVFNEKKIDKKLERVEMVVDKTVSDIMNILKIIEDKKQKAEKVYVYVMPFEKEYFNENKIEERVGKEVRIFAVNDKDKYDPKGISKKSKPGKPGIFVE